MADSAITIGVLRQATANPLVLEQGRARHDPAAQDSRPWLPASTIDVANDNSVFIEKSIKSVFHHHSAKPMVLVALVIFVFLRTVRASIIPIVTIPVSLIGMFCDDGAGRLFTINTLTLLALVLAIGLVVDDAIVMLENIFRHIEEGMDAVSLPSIKGAQGNRVRHRGDVAHAGGRVCAAWRSRRDAQGVCFVEFALALAGAPC